MQNHAVSPANNTNTSEKFTTPLQVYESLVKEYSGTSNAIAMARLHNSELPDDILYDCSFSFFAKYLNRVSKLSYHDVEASLSMLSLKNPIICALPDDLWYLRDAVMHQCMSMRNKPMERDIQAKFFDNLDDYLPEASKVKVKVNGKHIPDGFVSAYGAICPVEVKYQDFNYRAVKQLQRYMNHYGMTHGIAVAQKLKCSLPDNITFVKVSLDGQHGGVA